MGETITRPLQAFFSSNNTSSSSSDDQIKQVSVKEKKTEETISNVNTNKIVTHHLTPKKIDLVLCYWFNLHMESNVVKIPFDLSHLVYVFTSGFEIHASVNQKLAVFQCFTRNALKLQSNASILIFGAFTVNKIFEFEYSKPNNQNSIISTLGQFPNSYMPFCHTLLQLTSLSDNTDRFFAIGFNKDKSDYYYLIIEVARSNSPDSVQNSVLTFFDYKQSVNPHLPNMGYTSRACLFGEGKHILVTGGYGTNHGCDILWISLEFNTFELFANVIPTEELTTASYRDTTGVSAHGMFVLPHLTSKDVFAFVLFVHCICFKVVFRTKSCTFEWRKLKSVAPTVYKYYYFDIVFSKKFNKILCIGGRRKETMQETEFTVLDTIEVFDIETETWLDTAKSLKLPEPRAGAGVWIEESSDHREILHILCGMNQKNAAKSSHWSIDVNVFLQSCRG